MINLYLFNHHLLSDNQDIHIINDRIDNMKVVSLKWKSDNL